jgi:hypothetical protein
MGKMMNVRITTLWWVTDATYNPDAPSAAKLTTAANISCAVETGYTLGPVGSEKDTSSTVCDNANAEALTFYNYEGNLTFFREGDLANNTSDFAKAFNFFKNGTAVLTTGYLVRRLGYASTVAAAAGQAVSSYKFIPDNPQDQDDGTAPIRFTVNFKKQGKMAQAITLVA